jgi:hypothetical protein
VKFFEGLIFVILGELLTITISVMGINSFRVSGYAISQLLLFGRGGDMSVYGTQFQWEKCHCFRSSALPLRHLLFH